MQVDPKFVILEYLNGTGLCWNFWYSESRFFKVLEKRMQLNMFKLKWSDTHYLLTLSSIKETQRQFLSLLQLLFTQAVASSCHSTWSPPSHSIGPCIQNVCNPSYQSWRCIHTAGHSLECVLMFCCGTSQSWVFEVSWSLHLHAFWGRDSNCRERRVTVCNACMGVERNNWFFVDSQT